jgi:transcriptional regulator with XRE-family HTH domain
MPTYSRYAVDALRLLGRSIKTARIERGMGSSELADRVGISRATLSRIEHGDPASAIGSAFEAAAIVGVPLFEPEPSRLASQLTRAEEKLALMPSRVRPRRVVPDGF